jgi:hypothetical protein
MNIRKYRAELPTRYPRDFFELIDDLAFSSVSYGYGLYNPKTHDIVPKESYKKELVEEKKKERENLLKRAEELQKEIDNLQT